MKVNYYFFPKLVVFLNFFTYSSLLECEREKPILKGNECVSYCNENQFKSGECIINNSIIKKRWINNIIKIENTNGELSISFFREDNIFLFATSSSNNEERIFYGIRLEGSFYEYPFGNNGKFDSFIKRKIKRSDNKEINNKAMCFIEYESTKKIFLLGSDNPYAEIIELDKNSDEIEIYSLSDLYKENKVIKGISSLLYYHAQVHKYINLIAITSSNDDDDNISNFNLSLYKFDKDTFIIEHHREEEVIKGKYLSCFLSDKNNIHFLISCFYLDINNNFTISLYEDVYYPKNYFSLKNTFVVGKGYEIEDNKYYFMKGALSQSTKQDYGFYAFYSGDLYDIPTFLYKNIEGSNFTDKYDDFPVIYLYDYSFNNELKFNDILCLQENHLIFISTLKNREVLIIAYMIFYQSSNKIQFIVRYYTILLKEYYNIKIFHGIKASSLFDKSFLYSFYPSIVLAIDFSVYDSSQNSENDISNAGIININYPNINNRNIDFIEIAFETNKKYILFNLTQNISIDNNLFGFNPTNIEILDPLLYINSNYTIKYTFEESGEIISELVYLDYDFGLIRVDLTDYNFEDITIFENYPALSYSIVLLPPKTPEEFNLYCDNINNTYGNENDDSSIPKKSIYSGKSDIYIKVKEDLKIDCNENCTLCLKNDASYCIICEDKFTIIYNKKYKYGKKKVCQKINITEEFILNDTSFVDKLSNEQNLSDSIVSTYNDNESFYIDKLSDKSNIFINNESDTIINEILKTDLNENEIENKDEIANENAVIYENEIISEDKIMNKNEINNKNEIEDEIDSEDEMGSEDKITNENELINEDEGINDNELINEEEIANEDEIINEKEKFNVKEIINEDEIVNEDEIINEGEITKKYEIIDEYEVTNENENSKYSDSITENEIIETDKLSYENNLTNDFKLSTISEQIITNALSNLIEILLDDFLNGKYKDINLSNEQIKKLYEEIKDYMLKKYDGNNTIKYTKNVKIQISKIDDQKYSEELSNIDLGECEEILKNKYCKNENDSLIMLKFDIKPENETSKSTYVQYEIYDPFLNIFLKLEECLKSDVIINAPIELDSEIEKLYEWLLKSGYNLFDSKDSFYNDICAAFTTQNGTDILLYDRRMDIYQSTVNISLCQEGCDFQSYNLETKKAKCNCFIQSGKINTDISDLSFFRNEMIDEFYETLDNSNFRVLKCYKLVFNWKIFVKNIGSIFMTILIILYDILVFIHLIKNTKKINLIIQSIIKNKYLENKNGNLKESKSKKSKKNEYHTENISKIINFKEKKKRKKKKKKILSKKNSKSFFVNKENINHNLLNKINSKNAPPKKRINKKILDTNLWNSIDSKSNAIKMSYNNNNILLSSNSVRLNLNERSNISKKDKNKLFIDINQKDKENIEIFEKKAKKRYSTLNHKYSTKLGSPKKQKNLKKKFGFKLFNIMSSKTNNSKSKTKTIENCDSEIKKETEIKKLTDQEINTLDYEKAIELDKRTYFQYYISLLKKKHLILFTFLPANDYNLMSLKLSLFLVSFSLYFTINGFFFSDETMHKIYKDSGIYNILYQIPQILYSSLVSSFINMLLKSLSLSEKDILKIKHEQSFKSTVTKSKKIEKCIRIKFIIFFIISLLLMIFFWYFISCFCAVYNNTQIILLKDTLISFGLSMTYPLAINLLPGMFRIPALRAKKKDKKCLYSFSKILSLI